MPEGQESSTHTPMDTERMSNEHFISTGIAGQVLTLKYQPIWPLAVVRYCDANGKWQNFAPTGYTDDGGRNLTLIAAVTRAANVLAAQATAGASTTITKAAAGWVVNAYRGKWIVLTGGTGAGQVRRIVSNDATSITISVAWDTNPDATTTFEVLESDGSGPFNIRVAYTTLDPSLESYDSLTGCLRVQDEFPAGYRGSIDASAVTEDQFEIRSAKATHFTTAIGPDAFEDEDLTGIPTNICYIDHIMVQALEPLDFELWLFNTATMEDSDVDADSLVDIWEFGVEEAKRLANTGQYYWIMKDLRTRYQDLDGTNKLHIKLVIRNAEGKQAGAAGYLIVSVKGRPLTG